MVRTSNCFLVDGQFQPRWNKERLGQTGVLEKRVTDGLYRSIGCKERTESGDSLSERYCEGCRNSDDATLMELKEKTGPKNIGGS